MIAVLIGSDLIQAPRETQGREPTLGLSFSVNLSSSLGRRDLQFLCPKLSDWCTNVHTIDDSVDDGVDVGSGTITLFPIHLCQSYLA